MKCPCLVEYALMKYILYLYYFSVWGGGGLPSFVDAVNDLKRAPDVPLQTIPSPTAVDSMSQLMGLDVVHEGELVPQHVVIQHLLEVTTGHTSDVR